MLVQTVGRVVKVTAWDESIQEVRVSIGGETEATLPALNYFALTNRVEIGDEVQLNTTAQVFHLGTGYHAFVMANLTRPVQGSRGTRVVGKGHIIKARYTPCQLAVLTLEEQDEHAAVWEKMLDDFPVLVGGLHSQIAPAAAGLTLAGKQKIAYVMTDAAALPLAFSKLVRQLKAANLISSTLTCGQAFGGDYETVTLHSALLAARHILHCDAAIVCQGPGNAGTGTKYGYSGIEQAQNLDIVKALEGTPIAVVRMSSADVRERHQGISHHTRTTLDLAYSRCIVPLPVGTDDSSLPPGHAVRFVPNCQSALDLLVERQISVTTMGRAPDADPDFFLAAAAAGLCVGD